MVELREAVVVGLGLSVVSALVLVQVFGARDTQFFVNSSSGQNTTASCDSYLWGVCDFGQRLGFDLQFKKFVSNDTKINIGSNSSNISFACPTCALNTDVPQKLLVNTTITTHGVLAIITGTNTNLLCGATSGGTYTGTTEHVTATSALIGKTINSMTVGMIKASVPTGTATIGVFDSNGNTKYTAGTIDVSTLTTSIATYIFTNWGSTYTIVSGDYVGVKCPTETGANQVLVAGDTGNVYDGTNSVVSQFFNSVWTDTNADDMGSSATFGGFGLSRLYTVSFQQFSNYVVSINAKQTGSGTAVLSIWFNQDQSTNYSWREFSNGATTTGVSNNACLPFNSNTFGQNNAPVFSISIHDAIPTDRKIAIILEGDGQDTNAGTAPNQSNGVCKWSNTSSQISSIQIGGTGTLNLSGTPNTDAVNLSTATLQIWGYN